MTDKLKNISDIFSKDLFNNLKHFIFDENFDSFFQRRMSQQRNYSSYDTTLWKYPTEEMSNSNIYPITYDDFYTMYNEVGVCAYFVDKHLFAIKYLMKQLFENEQSEYLQNEDITIKLSKNFIFKMYKNVFEEGLYNSTIISHSKFNPKYNKFLLFDNQESIDLYARNIICSIFEYIQEYLENLARNLIQDNESIIDSYIYETRHSYLSYEKNKSQKTNDYLKEILTECKNTRNKRLTKSKGRPKREITGYFPIDSQRLNIEIQRIKDEYSKHTFIRNELRKIMKGEDKENVRKNVYKYLTENKNTETYITLDDCFTVNTNGYIDDISIDLLATINNYIDLKALPIYKDASSRFGISDVILYTLLEKSGDLKLYEKQNKNSKKYDFDILKEIHHDFKKRGEKPYKSITTSILNNDLYFKKKYKEFFTL